MTDGQYMKIALELAKKGEGYVSPNPMVGAVVVKNGEIIGQGYHERYGELHAERNALAACTADTSGATLYVTLEPCCHYGKTPPCTDAIIDAKIARVVIGSDDPNPKVNGKGARLLEERKIAVTRGVLKQECDGLNAVFLHYISTHTPFVTLKYAMTLDGKIATVTKASRYITGEAARERVHADRSRYRAIMVGVNTVLADDPLLTSRIANGRNPMRIICDSRLRTPTNARVVTTAHQAKTIIATCVEDEKRHAAYIAQGCKVLVLPKQDGRVSMRALMARLGAMGVDSVLLEGGSSLGWSALESGIVKRVQAYVAPKIFGGSSAPTPVGGAGVKTPQDAFLLSTPRITILGGDIMLESEVISCSQE